MSWEAPVQERATLPQPWDTESAQTTHTTRARVDSIRYKVNVNTMEQSSVDHLELNEIGRVVFTTGKELFFDPYRRNKQTGSFILIDPITNNTSAVGMIIDRVDAKDMVTEDALATLNLPEMGIGEEYYGQRCAG